jgi:choline dehydrogenase
MKRSTSRNKYLRRAGDRHNLQILLETQVEKVIFSSSKEARGVVAIDSSGDRKILKSRLETIISAGAIHTPQILMLSGIGNKKKLSEFDIEVIVDNPHVGNSLRDHISFGLSFQVTSETTTLSHLQDHEFLGSQLNEYMKNQAGILTTTGCDLLGFERLSDSAIKDLGIPFPPSYPPDWPHFEFAPVPAFLGNLSSFSNLDIPLSYPEGIYASMFTFLVAGESTGSVTIGSKRIEDQPLLDLNFLSEEWDRKLVVEGFKRYLCGLFVVS